MCCCEHFWTGKYSNVFGKEKNPKTKLDGNFHVTSYCKTSHDNRCTVFLKVFWGGFYRCTVALFWNSLNTSAAFARLRACWAQSRKAPASPGWPKTMSEICLWIFMDLYGRRMEKWIKTLQEWSLQGIEILVFAATSSCFDRFPRFSAFHFLTLRNFFLIWRCLQNRALQADGLGFALAELHCDVGTSTQKAIVVTGGHVQMELIHISLERIKYYKVMK